MASLFPERDTYPCPSVVVNNSTGLEAFDKAESEINSHFIWLHQKLDDRKKTILDNLREKRAEFEELEAARVGQLEEILSLKESLLNVGIKYNKSNVLRKATVGIYDDTIEELKIPIQSQKIIFEKFPEKMEQLIQAIGLTFVDEDYTDRINPIFSLTRDPILKSINSFKNAELENPKKNDELAKDTRKGILYKFAFNSETNLIYAVIKNPDHIMVIHEDGTLVACIGEGLNDLIDICLDINNKLFYVLDGDNCIFKFDLGSYQLLKNKKIEKEEIEKEMLCLDVHNGDIYVGTAIEGVHVFSSEFEHIRAIQTNTFCCIDIICRDEDILTWSLLSNELNIYSYNGDFIKNISLSFTFGMEDIAKFIHERNVSFGMQFEIDKNGLIFCTNPLLNCLFIQTFSGYLVHQINILPEENATSIYGVVCTNEGRIIISVANSESPLRYY